VTVFNVRNHGSGWRFKCPPIKINILSAFSESSQNFIDFSLVIGNITLWQQQQSVHAEQYIFQNYIYNDVANIIVPFRKMVKSGYSKIPPAGVQEVQQKHSSH